MAAEILNDAEAFAFGILLDGITYITSRIARLDRSVGWVPDTGHILRGGQLMDATLRAYLDRIRYVHLKDVDTKGIWAMLGAGSCDIAQVITTVAEAPLFTGWIVVEEESDTAAADPASAVRVNLQTLRGLDLAMVSA